MRWEVATNVVSIVEELCDSSFCRSTCFFLFFSVCHGELTSLKKKVFLVLGYNSNMPLSFLRPYFYMSKTRSVAQILIWSWLLLTTTALYLSLRVAPLDLQQGGISRISYVHVPAARMSILVYIAAAINTLFFLVQKHPFFLRSSGTSIEMGALFTVFTLVTGGFWGRPMWGTFWVWDARLTSVFILLMIYLGALCFHSCRTGFYFNPCWPHRYTNNKVFRKLVEYIASTWEH